MTSQRTFTISDYGQWGDMHQLLIWNPNEERMCDD